MRAFIALRGKNPIEHALMAHARGPTGGLGQVRRYWPAGPLCCREPRIDLQIVKMGLIGYEDSWLEEVR
jgi:hypothetical protein